LAWFRGNDDQQSGRKETLTPIINFSYRDLGDQSTEPEVAELRLLQTSLIMLRKIKIERAAYTPLQQMNPHEADGAGRFDVALWLSEAQASQMRELVEVAGHDLEIRLYVDGRHAPFNTKNSSLQVPGLPCNLAQKSTSTIACPGLEMPTEAVDVLGALPTLEFALFLDS
jgi:hypothetical protein